ncbi:hypothetical protein [Streptomyces ziwulingensis]|uniref:Uncharacterized protein n=1 Tax=Streptomyces ziwulingensis TaxID=1045501 RepID=A0ABP9D2W7_9ACTN
MARLQILELPEGAGDDRPPFILVIDQVPTDETKFDALRRDLLNDGDLAPRLGARAVLVFEDTIDIPANVIGGQAEPLLRVVEFEDDEETLRLTEERDELHAAIGLAHGQLHSAALSAIRGKHANIRELIERAEQAEAERDEALSRVRAEVARIRAITPTWGPVADLIEAALNGTQESAEHAATDA